jgi:nicotinate-nucleotide adenylyltransferase
MKRAVAAPRTGIFGGTFNPIHVGHLRAAEEAREALGLARVIFVPSARPPHKRHPEARPEAALAPAEDRLRWVELAVRGNPHFLADPLEIGRAGPSYSLHTVEAIGARVAPERPVVLIGCDAFRELHTWHEPARLLTLAHFAVLTRPPLQAGTLHDYVPEALAGEIHLDPDGRGGASRAGDTWLRLLPVTALAVSSSDIRARLSSGRSARYLLPDPVLEAVSSSGAYAGGRPACAPGAPEAGS